MCGGLYTAIFRPKKTPVHVYSKFTSRVGKTLCSLYVFLLVVQWGITITYGPCIPNDVTLEVALFESQKIVSSIQASAPVYHSRALRKHMISQFGKLSHSSNLALLREFYRQATDDHSASLTTTEAEMDARLREVLEMEDPDLIIDLRENNGRTILINIGNVCRSI